MTPAIDTSEPTSRTLGIMALIVCPDCGQQLSDAAPACVRCGRPMGPTQQWAPQQQAWPQQAPQQWQQPPMQYPGQQYPYPMQQQPPQPSTAAKVAVSGVRVVGCLTILLGFAIGVGGCLLGANILAMVVGGGLALVGIAMAAVNRVS